MAVISKETSRGLTLVLSGEALFPKLTEPETKFNPEGVYTTKLILSDDDATRLYSILEELRDVAVEEVFQEIKSKKPKMADDKIRESIKVVDLPLSELTDKETGEGTGQRAVTVKCKASGVNKKTGKPWKRKVPLFDSKGHPVKQEGLEIWSGSRLRVNALAYSFNVPALGVGISLTLEAAQILSLSNGSRNATSFGFAEEEDGWIPEENDGLTSVEQTLANDPDDDGSAEF